MFTIGNRSGNNRKPNMSAAGNNFIGKGYVVGGTMNMNSVQRPCPGNVTSRCYLQGGQNYHHQQQRNLHNTASRAYQPPAYIANGTVNNNSGNGLINGIKNFVNGLINPGCDFYSDHHRYYNPKYRNNYKHGADQQFTGRQQNHQPPSPHYNTFSAEKSFPDTHLQTVFIDLNASKISRSQPQKQECGMDSAGVVAIFTSEDFPALPTPRRPPTPSAPPTAAPTTRTGPAVLTATASVTIPSTSTNTTVPLTVLPSWEPEPKQKCAYFEFIEFSNPVRRRCGGPMGLRPSSRASQVSECGDSDDSFVIFSHDADSTIIATSPASSTSSGRFCRPQRERQLSECSDDSFVICFSEDAADGVLQVCNDSDDEDSETDEEEESDEDDTDDEADDDGGNKEESRDMPDGKSVNLLTAGSRAEIEIFAVESHRENPIENKTDQSEDTTDNVIAFLPNQLDSGFDERIRETKKVRFNLKPQVRVMHTWEFAHRKCRKGPWEQFARDCFRFKQRIENLQEVLDPILDGKHREKIYQERFCQKEIKS